MARKKTPKPVTVYPQHGGMYQAAFRSAQNEMNDLRARLESIEAEKSLIEQRIKLVEETVSALSPLCSDEDGAESVGLKEACIQVLKNATEALTVPEIKAHLHAQGVHMSTSYKNPLAVLHTTLNRLVVSGDAKKLDDKGKIKFYRKR